MVIDEAGFAMLLARAGLTLPEAVAAELRGAFPLLQAMTARNGVPPDRAAEPAMIFAPASPELPR